MLCAARSRAPRWIALCLLLTAAAAAPHVTTAVQARRSAVEPEPATRLQSSARALNDAEAEQTELRVLLIGNSYTLSHTLHLLLQRVAAGVAGGPPLRVDVEARGGYSLHSHWRAGQALARIRSGRYTHVVLQGHSLSALDHLEQLQGDAEHFKQAIDSASGHTVLYATWPRSPEASLYRTHKLVHSFADMAERVANTYSGLSQRLGAGLAPVGRAFERALVQHPSLALWAPDGSHPTLAGSYMAACVLYGTLTSEDPRASSYLPPGLSQAQADLVRTVAAESVAAQRSAPAPEHVALNVAAE
jgi:hypothetical protein